MKTILVPTDFSKGANKALNYAVLLAKKTKSRIILLHVYNMVYVSPDIPMEYYNEELEVIEAVANKKLTKIITQLKSEQKIQCEALNIRGIAADVIIDTVKKKKITHVIMGTKGASGVAGVLLGSNTAKVASKSKCPVIVVPEKVSFSGVKNIVYATDFHASDIVALKQLVEFAGLFKATIHLVHVADGEFLMYDEKILMEKFTKKVLQKVNYKQIETHLLFSNDVEKKLEQYIKKEKVDLLAVSTKHRNIIERMFGKSITRKLVYHTQTPMIVFHYKQEPFILI